MYVNVQKTLFSCLVRIIIKPQAYFVENFENEKKISINIWFSKFQIDLIFHKVLYPEHTCTVGTSSKRYWFFSSWNFAAMN